jgi:hypothetical protein
MYPNLERQNKLEDLVEVSNRDVEAETIKDNVQRVQPTYMDSIRWSLLEREHVGYGGPLKLTFMRVPVERQRTLCQSCFHVIDSPGNSGSRAPFYRSPTIGHGRFCYECVDRKFKILGLDRHMWRGSETGLYQDPEGNLPW